MKIKRMIKMDYGEISRTIDGIVIGVAFASLCIFMAVCIGVL